MKVQVQGGGVLVVVVGGAARALLAALSAFAAGAAAADEPLWELGLGAAALHLPHYRGSDQSRNWLLPVPYFVYRGEIVRADREGARALLFDSDRVEVDLSLNASPPNASRDNHARAGMPDLAPTVEFGPSVVWRLARGDGWRLRLELPLRAAFTLQSRPRHVGWVAAPKLGFDVRRDGWNVGLSGGPLWGSRDFHAYTYDVAPALATPQRAAYASRAGRGGWQLTAATSRRFGDWWLGAFVRADSLSGAAFEASPLVRRQQHVSYGIAVSRVLAVSGQRVSGRE